MYSRQAPRQLAGVVAEAPANRQPGSRNKEVTSKTARNPSHQTVRLVADPLHAPLLSQIGGAQGSPSRPSVETLNAFFDDLLLGDFLLLPDLLQRPESTTDAQEGEGT